MDRGLSGGAVRPSSLSQVDNPMSVKPYSLLVGRKEGMYMVVYGITHTTAHITAMHTLKIPSNLERFVATLGVMNQEWPSSMGGPPDWAVVQEGNNAIPILGELSPQDDGAEHVTSLPIPEGYFTDSPLEVVNGLSGVDPVLHTGGLDPEELGKELLTDAWHTAARRRQQRCYPVDPNRTQRAKSSRPRDTRLGPSMAR